MICKKLTLCSLGLIVGVMLISKVALTQNNLVAEPDTTRPMNIVSLSFTGEGTMISANYERLFLLGSTNFIAGRIGVGYAGNIISDDNSEPENYLTIPHHITGNIGKKIHFLEVGISGAIITGDLDNHYMLGPLIGYRLQAMKSNKLNLRIFGTVPFLPYYADIFYLPLGISVGYCF